MSFLRVFLGLILMGMPVAVFAAEGAVVAADGAGVTDAVHLELRDGVVRQFVDWCVEVLQVGDACIEGNGPGHWMLAAGFVVLAVLLRRLVVPAVFRVLFKVSRHTKTRLDDLIYSGLEQPAGAFVLLMGLFAASRVLFIPEALDRVVLVGARFAFFLTFAWSLFRVMGAIFDYWNTRAVAGRKTEVRAFMPWIRRAAGVLFFVIAVLMIAQSFGFEVKTFIAGLGLGGLAFALAAQDTIANLFGAVVVAMDQPFRVGDSVQIGNHSGTVEDIGLRSIRLRTPQKTLLVVPNKIVSTEAINNHSQMTQRRVDQVVGLTYDTTPEAMEGILGDIREILGSDPSVAADSFTVNFTSYGASSLDIQMTFFTVNPDSRQHLVVRERVNLAIMRAVAARGLAFAFPSQTVYLDGEVARKMAKG